MDILPCNMDLSSSLLMKEKGRDFPVPSKVLITIHRFFSIAFSGFDYNLRMKGMNPGLEELKQRVFSDQTQKVLSLSLFSFELI